MGGSGDVAAEVFEFLALMGGAAYLGIRPAGIALALNDADDTTFKASSPEKARRIHNLIRAAAYNRQFDKQIHNLLNRIPLRGRS